MNRLFLVCLLTAVCSCNLKNIDLEEPRHIYFMIDDNYKGYVSIFQSKNCGFSGDTILLNNTNIVIKQKIPNIIYLNGVRYWHFLRKQGDSIIEIPEYPIVDKSNLSVTMNQSGSVEDFEAVFLRISNVKEDTLYLKNGNDTWRNNQINDSLQLRFVDSLFKCKCKSIVD
jgi:hypothetical protein